MGQVACAPKLQATAVVFLHIIDTQNPALQGPVPELPLF